MPLTKSTSMQDNQFASAVASVFIDLVDAVNWMSDNLNPEDVFYDHQLEAWAEKHGWTKEATCDSLEKNKV